MVFSRTNSQVLARLCCATALALAVGAARAQDTVVDNDAGAPGYTESGTWTLSGSTGWNGTTYRYTLSTDPPGYCVWRPTIPAAGDYDVYAAILRSTNRTIDAPYTITHAGGTSIAHINQSGGLAVVELFLGRFNFSAGTGGSVRMDNNGGTGAYIADAVIFRPATPQPPQITQMNHAPGSPTTSDTVALTARITFSSPLVSATATYTPTPPGTPSTVTVHDDGAHSDGAAGDSVYGAFVPAQPLGAVVQYYFSATDNQARSSQSAAQQYTVGAPIAGEWRCIWADSWNTSFLNLTEAQDLVNTCRANNINTVIVEVRKIGDAYYSSALEPRATNISGGAAYDPLGQLIQLAHDTSGGKKHVQVHAWFVAHRISKGETLAPAHVLVQHPEYEMVKSDGTKDSANRFLDPGHPGTVDHNVAVILDCLSKYDIDGINLDYIRYPESAGYWGYNPVSVSRFNTVFGRTGSPAGTDAQWSDWRRECVALEVKKIYIKAWKLKPLTMLTACTVNWGSNYTDATYPTSSAYSGVFQDWAGWLDKGIIDYNALMDYTPLTSTARFQGWANLSFAHDGQRGSIIGIGAYLHSSVQGSMDQLLWVRQQGGGLNIYDWGSEVQGNTGGETRAQFYSALKAQVTPNWVDPPQTPWKQSPTTGIYEGTVKVAGQPVDHATVSIVGQPATQTVTDGSGWFGILNVAPGAHTLRFSKAGLRTLNVPATITSAGQIVTLDIGMEVPVGVSTVEIQ
jgi:uncharacterized lipoprotein YddW (UPF0748 family)